MRYTLTLLSLAASLSLCAQLTNVGPDAPTTTITYTNGLGFTFGLSNPLGSNNVLEQYVEPIIPSEMSPDTFWRFQGYAIFQFESADDTTDDLHLVIKDLYRSTPLFVMDLADNVAQVSFRGIQGADSCAPSMWFLDNTGTQPVVSAFMDPYTQAPFVEDSTYCFLAVAFATNPYHNHPDCGSSDQVLFSTRTPFGALQAQCVLASPVGIAEHEQVEVTLAPQPASHTLTIASEKAWPFRVRCINGKGALVHDGSMTGRTGIDVSGWAEGYYGLLLTDEQGHTARKSFVVVR